MRTFKTAKETLDALEEEILRGRKEAAFWKSPYVPTTLVVVLYRLAEVQIDFMQEAGNAEALLGSWEQLDVEIPRFEAQSSLGRWIAEQQ